MNFRRVISSVVLLAGIALVSLAYTHAAGIPVASDNDFDEFVRSKGGLLVGGVGGDAFRQMSANRRLLQNFYLGGAGLILLAAGCFGLVVIDCSWRPEAANNLTAQPTEPKVAMSDVLREHIARRPNT